MAKEKVNTQFLQNIASSYAMSLQSSECADIITFTRSDWGLNFALSPVQEVILKVFYGLPLDNEFECIKVPDDTGSKIIATFTQYDFINYLIDEGKTNIKKIEPGHAYKELILCLGRRSGKCNYAYSYIPTSVGTITFEELYNRIKKGEKISVVTHDLNGNIFLTDKIKIEFNGIKECFDVETFRGNHEIVTEEHPFLVWTKTKDKPEWKKTKDLWINDAVATMKKLPVFGDLEISNEDIISLAYLTSQVLPQPIKNANKGSLRNYIKVFFELNAKFKKHEIELKNENTSFLRELKTELLKFGIVSSIKFDKFIIIDDYLEEFKKEIGLPDNIKFEPLPIINYCVPLNVDIMSDFYHTNNNIDWDTISEKTSIGLQPTYALEVEGTNIIGNQMLTHNSVLSSIISTYETYKLVKMGNPQAHFKFPSGQQISVTLVSTTEEQSQTMFDMVRTRGADCTYLKDRIMHTTQTYFDVLTDDDREKNRPKGSVKLQSGGSSSAALRGSNNIVVIFDEAAFFQDGDGRSSGGEVYKALTPSILTFGSEGKILLLSSPNGKSGLFYNKYKESFDDTDRILMFQLYSALANPLVDSSFLKSEKRRDRKSFDCEYGANFLDTLSAWIDDSSLFEKCINHEITENSPKGKQGIEYFWGIDIGLKNDGTAITICHRDKFNEKVIIDYSNVWFSASSDVWDSSNKIYKEHSDKRLSGYEILPMEQIVEIIKELAENFPPSDGWFDQFNGQALYEMLQNEGFSQFRMVSVTNGINMQTFQTTKNLYTSGLIEFPNIELLITELYTLEEKRSAGSFIVEAPQRQGFHDDISVSLVRAVYACYNAKLKNKQDAVVLSNYSPNNYYQYQNRKAKMHGVVSERLVGRKKLFGR